MSVDLIETAPGRYRLGGELCIYYAAELKPRLLALSELPAVDIDLADVADVDTAGLQLLLMLKQAAPTRVTYHHPGAALADAIALLDLSAPLGVAVDVTGPECGTHHES